MIEASIPDVLRERASLQPDDIAFTYVDYEQDSDGVAESLTWSQVYRRAQRVAQELLTCASAGDRALILAPQGLDYITAFLGSLLAGLVAVPHAVPDVGGHDARVDAVLANATPKFILTTSAVVGTGSTYVRRDNPSGPAIVVVDTLGPASPTRLAAQAHRGADTAYLQYTSGSTRQPAGVMVSHRNIAANFEQWMSGYFADYGGVPPHDTTAMSWLPLYHDMGLMLGICAPILAGLRSVLISPVAFLTRPARWMQLVAGSSHAFTAAPNFAFELALRRISDEDMAGRDLGDVLAIVSGSERIQPDTVRRFTERFARFNLRDKAMRASYGLAEATVYVATRQSGHPPEVVRFEPEKLSIGYGQRCESGSGSPLISYGVPWSPVVRIVDPDTRHECPATTVGEIWVHGDNVAAGYWRKPDETRRTFGASLDRPSPNTPEGPWLRTGDLGFISEGELFIMGRIKDVLIVYGRNHYPDDLEATVQQITGGRVAVISVPTDHTEKVVAIVEVKDTGGPHADLIKREVTAAISASHGLSLADLVLVERGSIPITTSGKIRRSACVERYRQSEFTRMEVST
jgi:fatty acid CoA ligase FadD28